MIIIIISWPTIYVSKQTNVNKRIASANQAAHLEIGYAKRWHFQYICMFCSYLDSDTQLIGFYLNCALSFDLVVHSFGCDMAPIDR